MTYKAKNKYLIFGFFGFTLFVYFFTIKKTLDLKLLVEHEKSEIEHVRDAPLKIATIESKLKFIELKMKRYFFANDRDQEYIMGLVSHFCSTHQLILKEFPQVSILDKGDFNLETTIISVQGSYSNILDLVYYFEQRVKIGRISSVSFHSDKDYNNKRKTLIGTIFLQSIRKKQ